MDVLRHEMHHKDHWDKIKRIALTSGKCSDIVKAELEAPIANSRICNSAAEFRLGLYP